MARVLTAQMTSALTADVVRPVFFYEGFFVDLTLRLCSGLNNIVWGGKTWLGNGWFRGFNGIEEDSEIGTTGMEIELAGVPLNIVSTVLGYTQQNAPGYLWFGLQDASGAIISDPYLMFSGRLDVPTIEENPEESRISISYESKFIDLDRSKEYRYTTESQKLFLSTDKGFEYMAQLAVEWKGQWGALKKEPKKKSDREATKKKGGGSSGGKNRK